MKIAKIWISVVMMLMIAACTSVRKPTQVEVLDQFESIKQLDQEVSNAKSVSVDTYAPQGFSRAEAMLNESILLAQENETSRAVATASNGLKTLEKAREDAENIKKVMWEVIAYRDRAINANAPDLFKEEFGEAEEMFRRTTALIENGEIPKAKGNQATLIQKYSDLERQSLEKGVIELAKMAFEQAKTVEAEKYAPKTFARAQKELNLAIGVLETDRTRTAEANRHATLSAKLAKNATQISELAKMFSLRDYSYEDSILWYWEQLEEINKPFGDALDFQQPNHLAVRSFQQKIAELIQANENAAAAIKKYELQISELQLMQAEKDRIDEETRRKFTYVQSLFTPEEAQVFRKGDNVLISAKGFYFPSGGDEIQSSNFGLLNKILKAIGEFPNSRLEISGHTDSVGAAAKNLVLSEKRAQKVANFLMDVGQISAERIIVKGYGDTRPVAVNNTKEGRDQNRRIEVLIVNE